jgi:hypothetical protein
VPRGVDAYFLPVNVSEQEARRAFGHPLDDESFGILYRPALLALAEVRYTNRKYDLKLRGAICGAGA